MGFVGVYLPPSHLCIFPLTSSPYCQIPDVWSDANHGQTMIGPSRKLTLELQVVIEGMLSKLSCLQISEAS